MAGAWNGSVCPEGGHRPSSRSTEKCPHTALDVTVPFDNVLEKVEAPAFPLAWTDRCGGTAAARGVTAPTSAVAAPRDVPATGAKGFSFLHVLSPRHKYHTSNTLLTSRTPSGTDCNPTTVLALPNPHLILNQDSRLPATPPLPAPGSLLPRVLRNPPLTDTGVTLPEHGGG